MISWMLALVPGVIAARTEPEPEPKPDVEAERDALKAEVERAWAQAAAVEGMNDELRRRISDLEGTVTNLRLMMEWQMRPPPPPPPPLMPVPPNLSQIELIEEQQRMMAMICNCTPARGDVLRRRFPGMGAGYRTDPGEVPGPPAPVEK